MGKAELHVMLDVETTGTDPKNSGIWQIGAVLVTDPTWHPLEFTINPEEHIKGGTRLSLDTLEWQAEHNFANWGPALRLSFDKSEEDLLSAFLHFYNRLKDHYPSHRILLWSKGNFDFHHLRHALELHRLPVPWNFRDEMDLRTLCTFFDSPVPKFQGAHEALADALHQARHLESLFNRR